MTTNSKIDLCKLHKDEYATPKNPVLVTVGEATYLAVCGRGEPGGPEFTDRIGALYGVAYTVKMTRKFAGLQDYAVCKLEGQWWIDGLCQDFAGVPRDQWNWRLMIRTPDIVKPAELHQAAATLIEKGKAPSADQVKLESLTEGLCVQMLHVGPYDREVETIARMKAFTEEKGLELHGRHHEIYLSDPRRTRAAQDPPAHPRPKSKAIERDRS
jgi:hypothetical protein